MHFSLRGYLFIALIALLGIAGTWSDDPALADAWLLPAALLLAGLAIEAWHLRGTRLGLRMHIEERLRLGRLTRGAFAFRHNRGRELEVEYARVLPAALRQSQEVRRVRVPPADELLDETGILPLRLGPGRFGDVPARVLGRFRLAWWSRTLAQQSTFSVSPDTTRGGSRAVAGEAAGETARRLPGAGVELLQLRDYVRGDSLSRIDWKATARRGALVSREYTEAQHLEIVLVIDAGRASRVRAGALDRLGLYANVAARLAEHAVSIDDRVGLLVYAERVLATCLPDRGLRAVTRLRRTLEMLESERGESAPVNAALQLRRMLRHRGLVVWLTDLADPQRNEALMQAVRALVPRHQPIVAAPLAMELAALAKRPARDWRDPSIALAAREHERRAARQLAGLQQNGIVVLQEPDARLDKAVLDAYLQLRRRKRV